MEVLFGPAASPWKWHLERLPPPPHLSLPVPTKFFITSQCVAVAAVKHQPLAQSPDGIFLPAQLLSEHKTQANEGKAPRKHH